MINRRQLLAATATGVVVGLVGASVTRGDVSIRFIGRQSTIIALLDTGEARAMLVLGQRDDDLLENIPGLKTVGNTRIDLVIASHRVLATHAAREHLQIDSTPTIAIQANTSLAPIRGDITPVTSAIELEVGDAIPVRITASGSGLPDLEADDPDFVISAKYDETRILFASSDSALRLTDDGACDLLAVPGSPGNVALARYKPQLFVSNSPLKEGLLSAQMQVFRSDPMVVQIERGGIQLRDDQVSS